MLAHHIGELLEIVYIDQSGKLSQRRIEIRHIRNGLVYADCLRSGEPRTFREENILAWQPSKAIRPTISVKDLAVSAARTSATHVSIDPAAAPANSGKQRPTYQRQSAKPVFRTSSALTSTSSSVSHVS